MEYRVLTTRVVIHIGIPVFRVNGTYTLETIWSFKDLDSHRDLELMCIHSICNLWLFGAPINQGPKPLFNLG